MAQHNFAAQGTAASSSPVTANQLLPGWIHRRRKSLDLTQADLAHKLACSLSTVQKVEEGERRPSKTLATSLLEALEIPEGERPVFMRLARSKPAPRAEQPTVRYPAPRQTNLIETLTASNNTPFPTNALIAREVETTWVQDLLAGDDARLVTLTGLPGVGKTRLVQHIAHSVCFEDGVCYVSLAALPHQTDSQLACVAVAKAIGKNLKGLVAGQDTPDQVIAHLREMHLLLVLDNFEHLLAARDLLTRLIQETRCVKLLITSRERLHLRAEHVVQLAGLPVGAGVGDNTSPALQLFLARASRVAGPAFAEKHAAHGAAQKMLRICRLVDGLPLGIEMACELTATQSLDEIGDAIERDMGVLHTPSPDVPEAHRSLRAVFASVWARLSPEEQRTVTRCAVFQSSFSFEDISRVSQTGIQDTRLRMTLDTLIEKSLLRRTVDDADQTQHSLYLLHPLLRQFVAQTPDP